MKDDFDEYLSEQLRNAAFREAYDDLEPEYVIVQALLDAETESGITREELSRKTGISQREISRLQNGNANPSIRTLKRLAKAMGKTLKIEFV